MQVRLKQWGDSIGIRFSKDFLTRAGLKPEDTLNAGIVNGQIILTPGFRHRSLRERAADYGGQLNLSDDEYISEGNNELTW